MKLPFVGTTHPERARVLFLLLDAHYSPVAFVLDADLASAVGGANACRDSHRSWEDVREWPAQPGSECSSRHRLIERSVADEFGIDAAVAAVVDVCMKEPVAKRSILGSKSNCHQQS